MLGYYDVLEAGRLMQLLEAGLGTIGPCDLKRILDGIKTQKPLYAETTLGSQSQLKRLFEL
jgi:hypothetical protein